MSQCNSGMSARRGGPPQGRGMASTTTWSTAIAAATGGVGCLGGDGLADDRVDGRATEARCPGDRRHSLTLLL